MRDEKEILKNDFKKRLYVFTLKLIDFIDKLPNDNVSKRIGDQLLRSGTSIIANFVEGQCASSKKDFTNFLITLINLIMKVNYGLHCCVIVKEQSLKVSNGF